MGMLIKNIQSDKVRAVITGGATPASDLIAMWPKLSQSEKLEAASYYGSLSILAEHAQAERDFCIAMENEQF